jgi:peroxiredoxin
MVNIQSLSLIQTNQGHNILDLSKQNPVLLVFLRHFGCVFCKESLHDISNKKEQFLQEGIQVIFVHMSSAETAETYFKNNELSEFDHISDPDCKLYASFGLTKGSFSQLFGLKTWIRGFEVATTKQIFPSSASIGDGLQMPGIFLIKSGEVIESFIHHSVADKPNYEAFIHNCSV